MRLCGVCLSALGGVSVSCRDEASHHSVWRISRQWTVPSHDGFGLSQDDVYQCRAMQMDKAANHSTVSFGKLPLIYPPMASNSTAAEPDIPNTFLGQNHSSYGNLRLLEKLHAMRKEKFAAVIPGCFSPNRAPPSLLSETQIEPDSRYHMS